MIDIDVFLPIADRIGVVIDIFGSSGQVLHTVDEVNPHR